MHVASRAQARRLMTATPVTYMIFDLLWLDGHSLMALPYRDRRELLQGLALSGRARGRRPSTSSARARLLLAASAEQGLEGIVAKRLDSTYEAGRAHTRLGQDQERRRARSS